MDWHLFGIAAVVSATVSASYSVWRQLGAKRERQITVVLRVDATEYRAALDRLCETIANPGGVDGSEASR
jgi:hypothetical protein